MKIVLFNDTRADWTLHIGSNRGANGENRIPARDAVTFDVPDGQDVFVKVWGSVAMVRFYSPDTTPKHPIQQRLADVTRMGIETTANLAAALRDFRWKRGVDDDS